ncbi:MAG: GNAT family N-acetyltransferase [Firmicutes bacterium]|nr:GNAT family N-acetyltransferase [Bacillota bacterium]
MDNLINNIEKLHTTALSKARVRNNLHLGTLDVVEWCQQAVEHANYIMKSGKNYYVYYNGDVITINAHSYTIITAHKINAKIRVMGESDHACLDEFLYQAIFIPKGEDVPPRNIINVPEIFIYIKNFGEEIGDLGVVAEQNGQVVGAAWTRIIHAYGHIDENIPELAISLLPEFRGYGIGAKLMKKLFKVIEENGYSQTSLSVQKDNPAVRFYQRLGYEIINDKVDHVGNGDYLMIKIL